MNAVLAKIYGACPVSMQNLLVTGYSAILDRQRYGEGFSDHAELLAKSQWFGKTELEAYQDEKLSALVRHAYDTVPYYRAIFDERRLKPADVTTRGDLVKLPLLTKDDIRKNFRTLISSAVAPSERKFGHTSGTTGSPLEVCYDTAVIHATYAALDRQYRWADCRLARGGDPIAVARGNVIVPLNRKKPPFWRYNHFHNQLLMSSFHMSKENLGIYFEEMRRYGVRVLDGYPSTLYVLAKHLKNSRATFPLRRSFPRPRPCTTSSARSSKAAFSAGSSTTTRSLSESPSRRSARRTPATTWSWNTGSRKSSMTRATRWLPARRDGWSEPACTTAPCR